MRIHTLTKPNYQTSKTALYSLLWLTTLAVTFLLLRGSSSAATISVAAGTDSIAEDSICHLSEAITNINDQATTHDDCTPTGAYGTDDTINLPNGTITLVADLPEITQSVAVHGQGRSQTTISGDAGNYQMFQVNISSAEGVFGLDGISAVEWRDYVLESLNGNIVLFDIEADGENADVGSSGAINIGSYGLFSDVSVDNVHIHNITAEDGYIHVLNIWNQTGSMEIDVSNVTINDITNTVGGINTMALGVGVMTGAGEGDFTGSVRNTTISNIYANEAAIAIGALASGGVGDALVDIDVTNTTINNINFNPLFGQINFAALFSTTAEGDGMESVSNISAQNIIVSDVDQAGQSSNCLIADNGTLFGLDGVGTPSITSLGGNLSDDASCNDYFTHPTDQTELSGLADTLGPLSDNGGLVPTIPLLPGSSAIDAGVPVSGLTTDARGVTRPQCAAYDSGAYEYNGTCPTPSTEPLTTPVGNNTTSYLVLPSGVTNASFTTPPANTIPSDPAFSYPASLVAFQFDTDPGATETVTLYFDLPGSPSDYIARKYNTTNQSFSTISEATITRETYNNQSLIKLTYPITDGGLLDQDNQVNGTIVDPVGLATQTTNSPDTGLQPHWLLGVKG